MESRNPYPSLWRIVFYALGLRKFIVRLRLVRWLVFDNFLKYVLQGCEKQSHKKRIIFSSWEDKFILIYRIPFLPAAPQFFPSSRRLI